MTTNVPAISAAVVAAIVVSATVYGALGRRLAALSPGYAGEQPPAAPTLAFELVRNTVLALAITVLAERLAITNVSGATGLALLLWIGVPVVVLAGSVFHEGVPVRLAAIHAGDWLLKLLGVTSIVALWR